MRVGYALKYGFVAVTQFFLISLKLIAHNLNATLIIFPKCNIFSEVFGFTVGKLGGKGHIASYFGNP